MMKAMTMMGCATCANTFREGGGDAAGWSILFLLMVILPVLLGIVVGMVRIARREQALLEPELRGE